MNPTFKKQLLLLGMIAGFSIWRIEPSSFYLSALPAGCCLLVLQYEAIKKNIWDYISGGLIACGMVANLLAISFNDGYMPVITQRAVTSYGRWRPAAEGDPLLLLCDRIRLGSTIFSIGDLTMATGILLSIGIAYARSRAARQKNKTAEAAYWETLSEEEKVDIRKGRAAIATYRAAPSNENKEAMTAVFNEIAKKRAKKLKPS